MLESRLGRIVLVAGLGLIAAALLLRFAWPGGEELRETAVPALIVAGVVAIIAGALTGMIRARSAARQRMISGEGLLARWHYDPSEWRRFVERDFQRQKRRRLKRFALLAVVVIAFSAMVAFLDEEARLLGLGIAIAVLPVAGALLVILPRRVYRRRLEQPGEALISADGIRLAGSYHIWNQPGYRLNGASLAEGDPPALCFAIGYRTKHGWQEYELHVPVPAGREGEALQILARFAPPGSPE